MPSDDPYMNTIERMEPNIAMVDAGTFYASAAISLKRIADTLDKINTNLDIVYQAVLEEKYK
jgi:hypothetical protein